MTRHNYIIFKLSNTLEITLAYRRLGFVVFLIIIIIFPLITFIFIFVFVFVLVLVFVLVFVFVFKLVVQDYSCTGSK